MPERPESIEPTDTEPTDTEPADWERRRRIAAVFGDVLPDTTSDERDAGAGGDAGDEDAADRWLRSQVPPHHG